MPLKGRLKPVLCAVNSDCAEDAALYIAAAAPPEWGIPARRSPYRPDLLQAPFPRLPLSMEKAAAVQYSLCTV